jgi:hypothetical protein
MQFLHGRGVERRIAGKPAGKIVGCNLSISISGLLSKERRFGALLI